MRAGGGVNGKRGRGDGGGANSDRGRGEGGLRAEAAWGEREGRAVRAAVRRRNLIRNFMAKKFGGSKS